MAVELAKDTLYGALMLAATGRGKFSALFMDAIAEGVSTALLESVSGDVLDHSFVAGTTQAMATRAAYTPENVALTTFTLPTVIAKGEAIAVHGYGAGGWKIAQNANQQVHRPANSTTAGVTGSVDSATSFDGITLLCVVANLIFVVTNQVGTPTFTVVAQPAPGTATTTAPVAIPVFAQDASAGGATTLAPVPDVIVS